MTEPTRNPDPLLSAIQASGLPSHVADRIEAQIKSALDQWEGPPQAPSAAAQFVAHASIGRSGEDRGVRSSESGRMLASRVLTAAVGMRGEMSAEAFAAQTWGEGSPMHASLVSNIRSQGGALVPPGTRQEFIDLLRPKVAVLKLGPVHVPMPEGSLTLPRLTTDATATYTGESRPAPVSQPETDSLKLDGKKLVTLVPISNSLIKRAERSASAVPRILDFIEMQSAKRMALRKDQVFIRSKGTEHAPKGLRYHAAESNVLAATAGPITFQKVLYDLGRMLAALAEADVPMSKPGWVLSPRVRCFLMFQALQPTSGIPFFLEMMSRGELLGAQVADTSNVPSNLGPEGKESEILLADFDQVLYGEEDDMEIETVRHGSYEIGSKTVSTTSRDESLVRLLESHDLAVEHPEAVAVMTGVTWGADAPDFGA